MNPSMMTRSRGRRGAGAALLLLLGLVHCGDDDDSKAAKDDTWECATYDKNATCSCQNTPVGNTNKIDSCAKTCCMYRAGNDGSNGQAFAPDTCFCDSEGATGLCEDTLSKYPDTHRRVDACTSRP